MKFFVYTMMSILFSAQVYPADPAQPSPQDEDTGQAKSATGPVEAKSVYETKAPEAYHFREHITAGVNLETYGGLNERDVATGNDIETDTTASINYKIDDRTSVRAEFEWDRLYGAYKGTASDTITRDPSLAFTKTNVFQADAGETSLDLQGRVYFPVSDQSQEERQITELRFYGTVSKEISKGFSAVFTINPRVFIQSQKRDTYVWTDGKTYASDEFRILSYGSLIYAFNEFISIEQDLGLYQKWWRAPRDSAGGDTHGDFLYAATFVDITPAKWVDVNIGIRQSDESTDLNQSAGVGNSLYSSDQGEWFMAATFTM